MERTTLLIVFLALLFATGSAVVAQTRTTPVTIFSVPTVKFDPTGNTVKIDSTANTVKIDSTTNTVKSEQSGAWTVRIDPFQNTVNALAAQNGTWNVSISGTPTVQANYSKITLYPGANPSVAAGDRYTSSAIDCRGFREMFVVINWNNGSPRVGVSYKGPVSDSYFDLGYYSGLVQKVVSDPDFTYGESTGQGTRCIFSVPVVGDYMKIWVHNTGGTATTLWGGYCYVYLVP